jgi:ribosomal protein L35AE/L33A
MVSLSDDEEDFQEYRYQGSKVPHQVGDSVHLVCYQETGDGHLEVLKGSLSGEHGSEGV